MTLRHIAAIHFEGHREAAKKRVQRLKVAGLIGERSRLPQEPAVHSISRKGFDELQKRRMLERYPQMGWGTVEKRVRVSKLTLQHELEVMDVKATFYAATRHYPMVKVAEFSTWPEIIKFDTLHPTRSHATVKPDGFIRLEDTKPNGDRSTLFFFLEVDRSTETLDLLTARICCYREFYKRGGLALRLAENARSFKDYPFRLLIVCKSKDRKDNIAARLLLLNPPIRTFVSLKTMDETLFDILT